MPAGPLTWPRSRPSLLTVRTKVPFGEKTCSRERRWSETTIWPPGSAESDDGHWRKPGQRSAQRIV